MRALLWRALRREPRQLVRICLWSVLEAAPAFLIGLAVARAIEDGFAAGRPEVGLAWLTALGAAWVVAAVAARQIVLAVAAVAEPFRDDLLTHVVGGAVRRAAAAPGARQDSAAVTRAGLQVELARDAFAAVVTTVRGFAFTVVSVVLGLLTLAPGAAALVLPPFAAGLVLFLASLPLLARRQREFLLADERLAEAMTAMAGGLRDIVACGAEDRQGARMAAHVDGQASTARALARATAVRTAALGVGGWLPVLLVLAGTPWLLSGGAGAGVVVGALAYVTQSLAPALGGLVHGLGVSGVQLAATLDRITAAPPPPPRGVRRRPASAEVRLREVTFAYGPHSAPVVDGLSLSVPEGEHLAVVGPSGAGKSTLAALISGLLRPDTGRVLVGGVPADQAEHAARVLIPQEAYVFRGTLRENLAYLRASPDGREEGGREEGGREDGGCEEGGDRPDGAGPGPAELEAAVRALGAAELVAAVGGYDAPLDPGALSAGQRQLIALVRAYLSPARLAILDEATCHLDPAAEARVEHAFATRGGTLVVVAHRITSARRAGRVLLMDGGRVQAGTHDELVRTSSLYADLVGHWQPEPVS
ncbi:ATP-binding cassette domain-containing protein [Nonomuraea cavernae]|uniref:ABC transporter ATP-binding protein n=1 Tax=Nonomuraea cavernae TaxID=2045107 RepID=A0A918DPP3_9ACTN|nr:ABC transporter ATP-binding protein [Nonomuraea cavernae]MCA2189208.1 ABC transporter ATP-binding protein/permease [Nonomuraea cavernae]GGO76720.1 ABC transporter ATP-binding protein [Nonomuraea cavernae]